MSDEEDKLYEIIDLWNTIEEIFNLDNADELYWKERAVREKANINQVTIKINVDKVKQNR